MPLKLPDQLPAIELLKDENIFVMDTTRAQGQDIRPLRIAILNLMPIKITTETDFIRILSNTPLQVEIEFMKIKSHTSKNTPVEHMMAFYRDFELMRQEKYDGLIVTGAPLEQMDYEEVTYWDELVEVFDWAYHNVQSTCYICWAAQAALYHFHKIPKYSTNKKVFGVFKHRALQPELPIFRGFDDTFYVPHSRHSELRREDIEKNPDLQIISESEDAGVHSEYAPLTLDGEYKRDVAKRLPIQLPKNYYEDDNPAKKPIVRWRAHANLLFSNWLNYYVYQKTPFDINQIV